MKKLSIYLMLAVAGLFMAACGNEDNELAGLKTATPDDAIVVPGVSASALGTTIDLNSVIVSSDLDVKAFNVADVALPEGVTLESAEIVFEDGTVIPATADGQVSGEALSAYIASLYGLRPEVRTVTGQVYLYAVQNGSAVKINAGQVTFNVIPKAPVIEPIYYLTGTLNGWDNTNTDYVLTNSGDDPYVDPVFTLQIPADQITGDLEFKFTPASGLGGDWSGCLAAADEEGKFNYNNVGGNFKVAQPSADAKFVVITLNMLDQTWTAEAISFAPYIYEAGVNNGWGGSYESPLYCGDGNGTYTGYVYAQEDSWTGGKGAFKLRGAADNWDNGNYGTGTFDEASLTGTLIDDGGSGNIMPDPGFYRVDANLADMTFSLTAINSIYVVGSAVNNDWNTGVEMTYNQSKHCWECDCTFTEAGVIKFKGNGTWDNADGNWGGTMDNIINGSNDNIPVSVSGDVHIEFYPYCDTKSYCVITQNL